jgi:hypothetical protein
MDTMEQPVAAHRSGVRTMTRMNPLVEGELGEGAFGPTILLRLASTQGATYLHSLFARLASSPIGTCVSTEDEPDVALSASIWRLCLEVIAEPRTKRLSRTDGGFTWVGTSEDWWTTALLVEPLAQLSGHQYLTSEGVDDAIIEVSQGED